MKRILNFCVEQYILFQLGLRLYAQDFLSLKTYSYKFYNIACLE